MTKFHPGEKALLWDYVLGEKRNKILAMPGERMRPGERILPVRRSKDLIVDKVKLNRVTLISADTGSGKSSQVPQMLLEENMVPILCTQPRRLAVVAVAKRVAQERECVLGEEVGYHIGQLNVSTAKSKIVFETAGILLEELRVNGTAALARYKVVILDEVHERSVESDMVLTCVKQLMLRNPKIRLVLMSATADFKRYEEYFSELGREERVERIFITNLAASVQNLLLQTKVKYLENAVEQLGNRPEHVDVLDNILVNPSPSVNGRTDIGGAILGLIRDLVVQFHATEPDVSRSVLIFLPTYKSLEQQWLLLNNAGPAFRLFVLHSSIDIEHSVKAMEIACKKRRKVILATNVAESSVTIPGVSYVVDSCRSLEIFWDRDSQQHAPRLVWISQSQADQRKGRTGRTCDGTVVRLVTRQVYHSFPKCETPQMQLFSLRKQVLMITSAESKAINDPICKKCMNPPALITVTDALEFLEKLRMVVASPDKGRHAYHPTKYGELLLSMPLSLESAMFVVRGGTSGYMRESVILGSIMDNTPFPVLQPFSQAFQYRLNLEGYFKDTNSTENGTSPSRTSVLLANLCAFEFWQRTLKDKHRLGNLEGRIKDSGGRHENRFKIEWGSLEEEESEEDWCIRHNLSLSALRVVAETADIIMEKMHQFRPEFICGTFNVPSYYIAENADHNCTHASMSTGPKVSFLSGDESGDDQETDVHATCAAWPFVQSGTYRSTAAEAGIGSLITEVQKRQSMVSPMEQEEDSNRIFPNTISNIPPQCSYFRQGLCTRGSSCPFSHSILAKPMPCKFYHTYSGCRYGNECRFFHDGVKGSEMFLDQGPVQFEEIMPSAQAFLDLIPSYVEYHHARFEAKVMLLGEGNFTFAEGLAEKMNPARIFATSIDKKEDAFTNMPGLSPRVHRLTSLNVQVGWDVDATNLVVHGNSRNAPNGFPWDSIGCLIWNFPFLGVDDDLEGHKLLMRSFFTSVALALFKSNAEEVLVMLTLCNDQFGRWQVERAARDSFLFLRQSIPFDTHGFGAYRPMRNNLKSSFEVQKSITYVFKLCWPSDKRLRTRLLAALTA